MQHHCCPCRWRGHDCRRVRWGQQPSALQGDGEKGPVERRLDELGTVFGIGFGSFGELSPGLEKLCGRGRGASSAGRSDYYQF